MSRRTEIECGVKEVGSGAEAGPRRALGKMELKRVRIEAVKKQRANRYMAGTYILTHLPTYMHPRSAYMQVFTGGSH